MEKPTSRSSVIIGSVLIAIGVLSLVGEVIGGGEFWPFIIILFGLAFFAGMLLGGKTFGALAIPGAIITTIGLILLVQNTFGLWETWSYAWGLVISAVGIGLVIYGSWSGQPELRQKGWDAARAGLVLFLIFGIIFEAIYSLTGITGGTAGIVWPVLLILVGIVQLILRSVRIARGGNTPIQRHEDVNLFWPVIFIGAGLLWLMTRLGYLTTGNLSVLINLWPILLVAAGINLLFGRRMQWINLLLGLAVVAGMFYVVYNGSQLGLASRSPWLVFGTNIERNTPITEWVTGSGVVKTETRQTGDFNQITLNTTGDVEIQQGSQAGLTIEADDNVLPAITSEVRGSNLVIETKRGTGFRSVKTIRYRITVKDLQSITLSGAASIKVGKLTTQKMDIEINGAGSFKLDDLQASSLTTTVNGGGSITAAGKVTRLDVEINGAGGFNGQDLQAEDSRVNISGLGSATVWTTKSLDANISGAGNVSYYGDPTVHQETGGISNVHRVGSK